MNKKSVYAMNNAVNFHYFVDEFYTGMYCLEAEMEDGEVIMIEGSNEEPMEFATVEDIALFARRYKADAIPEAMIM